MTLDKTFNAATAESRLYAAWENIGAFKAGANAKSAETYSVMIPPPNVNGRLHIGHAFNNTLQDILVRWHRMRGFDTLWQPGQDHAGIALQRAVELELAAAEKPSRKEMGRDAFTTYAWDYKKRTANGIVDQLKRLGATCDWSRNAFTMAGAPGAPEGEEGNFHDAVIKVFIEMYNKGQIYRGKRLVNWDPHFETAISDLEVENIEVAGHMWHFKYPLAGGETYEYIEKDEGGTVTLRETRDYISIATTRPETMLGDGAVAVHPTDERYTSIVGKLCEIPVGPKDLRRLIPIITDEYPDKDFGSGAVKITGAHDFNDYQVAKRGGIPMYNLMDTRACLRADGNPYAKDAETARQIANGEQDFDEAMIAAMNLVPEDYRGMDRFEARKAVVADITAEGLAVMETVTATDEDGNEITTQRPHIESKPIMQPFGDRSKVVIEPMLTDQWFVDTDQIVGPALDAVRSGKVKILPESGEKVYYNWLDNIEPWCISRQLWWGHQIPVWYGLDLTNQGFIDDEGDGALDIVEMSRLLMEQSLQRGNDRHHASADFDGVTQQFIDVLAGLPAPLNMARVVEVADRATALDVIAASLADYSLGQDPTHLLYPVWRDPDVLDTWFSSGLWPIGTLGWPEKTPELDKYFPTSDLITGQDILFFWVARMMMMQLAVVDEIPFKTVYLHGLVRDAKGQKMSKSVGNVIDPLDIIDEFGADALRFSSASMAALGGVLKLDMERIKGYRNFGTKLWNAHRFAEMNDVFAARKDNIPTPDAALNKWIIGETAKVRQDVDEALAAYRFNDAANALYVFVWGKVCDWYVELSKPLLQDDAPEAAQTRETMAWVLDQCLILLHPIMPFITEELWGATGSRAKMLIHADWPAYTTADLLDENADREINWVVNLIETIRSARAQMHVPAGAKVPLLVTDIDTTGQTAWDRNEAMIKRLARVETLGKTGHFPKGTVTLPMPGATFGLPLEGIIDIAAEKSRLEKTLGKLAKELGGLRGRLNNPKFAASAPAEVVAETKANLALREEEEDQLKQALARLSELD